MKLVARVDREERRHQRGPRIGGERPEHRRGFERLVTAVQTSASHRTPVRVSSSLGGKDRKRQERDKCEQRVVRRALEPGGGIARNGQARAFIARFAAERTSSGFNVVRHRKSPGSQTR